MIGMSLAFTGKTGTAGMGIRMGSEFVNNYLWRLQWNDGSAPDLGSVEETWLCRVKIQRT